jgi:uncharacterized coiled-coil protein SlyX/regulator of replication initiation timing
MVFNIYGIELTETELYTLYAIGIAILVAFVIFLILRARSPKKINREELYTEFSRLGEKKAKLRATFSVLEEMKSYSRISVSDYNQKLASNQKEIDKVDDQMDKILNLLALPSYSVKLMLEKGLETEKLSLLVKLQQELNATKGKAEELNGTIADLRERNTIFDAENADLKQKLDNIEGSYKTRVIRLEQDLDSARRSGVKREGQSASGDDELAKYKEKMEEYYHKILLYQLLIAKYKNTIEASETKNAQDVKSLVQPANSHVVDLVKKIKSANTEALKQYKAAYDAIDEIHSIPYIGATFWLSIADMLENKVADYEDKAILLCSILRALGANAKVLVASMTDGSNRPFVLITLKDRAMLLDPNKKHEFVRYAGKRNDAIKQFSDSGNKIKRVLYEFNDKDYISHEL